jgi:xylobiose transport system permease protein
MTSDATPLFTSGPALTGASGRTPGAAPAPAAPGVDTPPHGTAPAPDHDPDSRAGWLRQRWAARQRPNVLAGLGALVWLVIIGLPLYMMIASTLVRQDEYLDQGPLALPRHVTFDNFVGAFRNDYLRYLANNVIVTLGSAALVLLLAIPTGWAIVRSRSRVVSAGFRMFLLGLAIPAQAVIIPIYWIIIKLHLYDSLVAVILPTVAFAMPVSILVLASAMRDISEEMYEAAVLDGAGTLRILTRLVVPVSRASIGTVGIYASLNAWNGLIFPLILTQSPEKRVLPMVVWNYQSEYSLNVPGLLAAVLLSGLPMFVVYLLARRALIRGFMGLGGK